MKSFFADFSKISLKHLLLPLSATIFFFFTFLPHISAQGNKQTELSISVDNAPIANVLSIIEKQSSYRFIYNSDLKALQQKVSLTVKATPIKDLLNDLFMKTDLVYTIMENNMIVINEIAQNNYADDDRIVNGKVTGEGGMSLAGVSVQIRGTNKGVTTKGNGEFYISVSDSDVLVFSYVGYETQEISVAGKLTINVSLISNKQELTQVVVVGYGTQRKIDVTGATGSVKGSELAKQPVLTATQAIQGKVAGVQIISSGQPGSQPSVRIRGTGSILGGAEPLYVVDGIITTDITNINTADIVNVDILKDASSTAIYGARGANGVIIITTKQGASGKMQITYNGNVGIQSATHLVTMANAEEYANYYSASTYGITPVSSILTGVSTDWYGQILRNAVEQNHNISISGASDKTKYLFSVGYSNEEGIVINNDFKRFTARSNEEFKLADNLKLGVYASYTNGNNQNVNLATAYDDAYRAAPVVAGRVNGKYGNTSLYQNVGNPILDINDQNSTTLDNRLEGNAFLEYKPISSLTLRSSIGGDWDNNVNTVYNYAFAPDTSTFIVGGGNQSNTISSLGINSANSLHWVWDNTATFNKHFGKQNLTVLIGTTAEESNSSYIYASADGVPAEPNLWYIGNANFTYPFSTNGQGTKLTRNSYLGRINYSYDNKYLLTANFRADGSSSFPVSNRWGYFPSIGAGWVISNEDFMKTQHIFNMLKLRASWGQAGNDVTGAGSAGFTSTLLTGLPYYFSGSAVSGSIPSQIVDKDLKWETSTESDVAVEFSILNSRLSGEFSYYNKTTSNSLIYVLIPSTLGSYNPAGNAGYVLTNAASVQNMGEEFALNWHDKINRNFSYSIGANITFNTNNVVGLNGGQAFIDGPVGADQPYVTKTDVGHPIGSFYVQKVLGVFQSQAEIDSYTYNGKILQSTAQPGDLKYEFKNGVLDSVYAGSYQPKAYYGVNIGLNYKNFDVSISGYGTEGGVIYNGKRGFRQSSKDNLEASVATSLWTSPNSTNTNPSANWLSKEQPASTYFVEPGSYFRINNINIGYTVSSDALRRTKVISSLRIYVSAQNLVTITKYSGFTPEIQALVPPTATNSALPTTSSPTDAGIELNAYPAVKTYSLGINVGF